MAGRIKRKNILESNFGGRCPSAHFLNEEQRYAESILADDRLRDRFEKYAEWSEDPQWPDVQSTPLE